MPGPYGYDVTVKLAGLMCDMPRESADSMTKRRERYVGFGVSVDIAPLYADSSEPFDWVRTGEWQAEWKVWVQAFNADSARERAMLRVQEDPAYTPGMFEQAASAHFDVSRHM